MTDSADTTPYGVYLPEPRHCQKCGKDTLVYFETRGEHKQLKCRAGHWLIGTARPIMSRQQAEAMGQAVWAGMWRQGPV